MMIGHNGISLVRTSRTMSCLYSIRCSPGKSRNFIRGCDRLCNNIVSFIKVTDGVGIGSIRILSKLSKREVRNAGRRAFFRHFELHAGFLSGGELLSSQISVNQFFDNDLADTLLIIVCKGNFLDISLINRDRVLGGQSRSSTANTYKIIAGN